MNPLLPLPLLLLCSPQDPADEPSWSSYLAHIAAAEASLRLEEPAGLRRWLDAAPAEHRGFEWRWLDGLRDQSELKLRTGLDEMTAFALAPDGAGWAAGGADGSLVLHRDSASVTLAAHAEAIYTVAFGPLDRRLLTSSRDRTACLWDARKGELLVRFEEHGYPVGGAAFRPDGALVATSSYDRRDGSVVGIVHLWETSTGTLVHTLEAGVKPLVALAFSPDGNTLAAASWGFCLQVWDLSSDAPPRRFEVPDEGLYNAVDAVAFYPDGSRVVAGSKDSTARVWDVTSGELVLTLRGHVNDVTAVAVSADGALVATASVDETVRLWDAADGAPRGVLRGHDSGVRELAFLPDGSALWSVGDDEVLVWDPADTHGGIVLSTSDQAYACPFSPDGTRLAVCSFDGRIALWETATWTQLASWQAHPKEDSCHALSWSPDGERLYSGSYDGTVAIWDALTLAELGRLRHERGLYHLDVSPDGLLLASTDGSSVYLWDLLAFEELLRVGELSAGVNEVAFAPDGAVLAVGLRDGTTKLVAVATGEVTAPHMLGGHVAWSPAGGELVTGSGSTLCWWRDGLRSTSSIGNLGFKRLAWSPEGGRVAAVADVLHLIDPHTGEGIVRHFPRDDGTWGLAWSPDGSRLAYTAGTGVEILDAGQWFAEREARDAWRLAVERERASVTRELKSGASLEQLARSVRTPEQNDGPDAILGRLARKAAITLVAGEARDD